MLNNSIVDPLFSEIESAFGTLWDACNTIWTEIGAPVFEAVQNVLRIATEAFAERMPAIGKFVGDCFGDINTFWKDNLKPCLEAIGSFIKNILAPTFEAVFDGSIGPLIDTVFNFIKELWERTLKPVLIGITDFLTGVFTLNFTQAFEGLWAILKGILNGIITGIEAFVNGCITAINGLIGGINSLVEKAGEVLGLELSIPLIPLISLPKLAKGGILEKGQIGFLEGSGAEAVVPLEQNTKWISKVAENLNNAGGNNETLLEILSVLLELKETMPDEFAQILSQLKLYVGNREFARLIKAVN